MSGRVSFHSALWLGWSALVSLTLAQESGLPPLDTPRPALALRPARLTDLQAGACATCHAEVSAEWAASAHGLAWVDETYQAALKNKLRPDLCYGCHAPERLLAGLLGSRPGARATARERGVDCESCHADGSDTILGPRGTPVAAHPSAASEHLSLPGSNALCSACHATTIGPVIGIAKDFQQAGLAERGLSCVACHMAPVERVWADGAPPRTGRSHALQTPRDPAFLRRAFALEFHADEPRSRVVLCNQAGHRIPGLIGRELTFRFELLDGSGRVLEQQEIAFNHRAYFPVGATREVRFANAGVRARVIAEHLDPRDPTPMGFLDVTLAPE